MGLSEKVNKYKKYFESRTVMTEAFGVFLCAVGFADRYLSGLNTLYRSYSKLRRKFAREIGKTSFPAYRSNNTERIWLCWFQGLENAPELVRHCAASVQYHNPDREVVVITKDNFSDYCTLPDFIIDKWRKGIITNTHFSDILRLQLLIENGGIWMDATVYMTGAMPAYITDSDFFVYRNGWMDEEAIHMASWLIKSAPGNILLQETQHLIFEYWKKRNYLCQYFLLHLFFRMVSDAYPEEWAKVPYFNHIDQHLLIRELARPYDAKRFSEITALTPIHKLSYKEAVTNKESSYYALLERLYRTESSTK